MSNFRRYYRDKNIVFITIVTYNRQQILFENIELLRQSFSRGMNSTRNNLNKYKTNNEKKFETGPGFNFFTKNDGPTTGIKCLKGLRNKQFEKINFKYYCIHSFNWRYLMYLNYFGDKSAKADLQ